MNERSVYPHNVRCGFMKCMENMIGDLKKADIIYSVIDFDRHG